jgi:hypothetical protein
VVGNKNVTDLLGLTREQSTWRKLWTTGGQTGVFVHATTGCRLQGRGGGGCDRPLTHKLSAIFVSTTK